MSIESRSRQYGVVFEHWQIKDFLGSGSGGKSAVFRLGRMDSSWGSSALKVISLIEEKGNFDTISDYRRKEYELAKEECSKAAEQEVHLMDSLHGNTNIVDYLDHKLVSWSDQSGFGCDMLIRMELLEDLRSKLRDGRLYSEAEILKIGRDICTALVLCHGKDILHRDIKPENIFINSDGNFKLGDFGVSRILSSAPTAVASTGIGTPEYAAPEQFMGGHDKRVDIYSLGLVLYELSNGNKLPFATTGYARPMDVERRQLGEPLPAPGNASASFAQVILKACAYKKEDRYQTAEEFLDALNGLSGIAGASQASGKVRTASAAASQNATQYAGVSAAHNATQYAGAAGDRNATQYAAASEDSNATRYASAAAAGKPAGNATVYAGAAMGGGTPVRPPQPATKKSPPAIILAAAAAVVVLIAFFLFPGKQEDEEPIQTDPPHNHHWINATCTASRYCDLCGETSGQPLGHNWQAATYDAPKTCADCGLTEGTALRPEPKPLSEFAISAAVGKVWIRSTSPYYNGSYHTKADAPNCWKDWSKPGYTGGPVRDNKGNEYEHGIHIDGWDSGEYYYEIRLDGKYTTFSGICACPEKSAIIISFVYDTSRNCTKYFEVYGDGELLFTSATMRYDYEPQAFSVDVTDVQVLKIVYPATTGPNEVATIYDGLLS